MLWLAGWNMLQTEVASDLEVSFFQVPGYRCVLLYPVFIYWGQQDGLVKIHPAEPKDLNSVFHTQYEKRRTQTPRSCTLTSVCSLWHRLTCSHKINRLLTKIGNFVLCIYCFLYTGIYVQMCMHCSMRVEVRIIWGLVRFFYSEGLWNSKSGHQVQQHVSACWVNFGQSPKMFKERL